MSDTQRDPQSLLGDVVLPPFYSTEGSDDPIARARLYLPGTIWNWYPIEGDATTNECYGLVVGMEAEYGYFTLDELIELEVNGVGVQRDQAFTPMSAREIKRQHDEDRDTGEGVTSTPPIFPPEDSGIMLFILADGEDMDWDHLFNLFD